MPELIAITSDEARLAFLLRTQNAAAKDSAAGSRYIFPETKKKIDSFFPKFEKGVNAISEEFAGRIKEVREKNEALGDVMVYTRHLWSSVKNRISRKNEPVEVLRYYQLPADGVNPKPKSHEEWLVTAKKVVMGDSQAVSAGYEPAVSPSAPELVAVMDKAESELNDVSEADRLYDAACAEIADDRGKADDLIDQVLAELSLTLRTLDPASQRRIKRTYGARYRYLTGEPVEEGEIQSPPA